MNLIAGMPVHQSVLFGRDVGCDAGRNVGHDASRVVSHDKRRAALQQSHDLTAATDFL